MSDTANDKLYCWFDSLPSLPYELEKLCLDQIQKDDNLTRYIDPVTFLTLTMDTHYEYIADSHGQPVPCADYRRFNAPQAVIDWVSQCINPGIGRHDFEVGIQMFRHRHPGQLAIYAPHVDGPRGAWVINYIFDTGGSDVSTCWYQQKGYPVIRHMAHHRGLNLKSFQDLIEVDRVKFPARSWVGLETRAVHTVVNLESDRIGLSIGASLDLIRDLQTR